MYEAPFLRKIGKLKIGLNVVEGQMKIMQIGAYSKRSYEKTKDNLKFIFASLITIVNKDWQYATDPNTAVTWDVRESHCSLSSNFQ